MNGYGGDWGVARSFPQYTAAKSMTWGCCWSELISFLLFPRHLCVETMRAGMVKPLGRAAAKLCGFKTSKFKPSQKFAKPIPDFLFSLSNNHHNFQFIMKCCQCEKDLINHEHAVLQPTKWAEQKGHGCNHPVCFVCLSDLLVEHKACAEDMKCPKCSISLSGHVKKIPDQPDKLVRYKRIDPEHDPVRQWFHTTDEDEREGMTMVYFFIVKIPSFALRHLSLPQMDPLPILNLKKI